MQEPLNDDSPVMPWLVEHAGCILSRCQKGRDGKTPFERLHGKRPTQEFVPFGEKVLAGTITTDPMNRMNPRYKYGIWLVMRNNSAECFIGTAHGVFRAGEIRRLEPRTRWDTEAINSVIGVPWRMTDGKWTVDRPEVRVDPIPVPLLPFDGARIQRETITKQGINEFGATIGCPGCSAIKDNKRAQAHSDRCRRRIEECLRVTPHGAERLDRRNEVINEALAEEVQRGEQRKKRSDKATFAVPESAPAASEPREAPVEPDPNPKKEIAHEVSAANDQRQWTARMQVEDMSEMGTGESTALPSANIQRRTVVKSEPVAVTTQEAVDGYVDEDREC